jgi:hypothetical protein
VATVAMAGQAGGWSTARPMQAGGTRIGPVTVSPRRRVKQPVRGAVPCAGPPARHHVT